MENKESFWSPLDNAAKIFPAIRSKENTTVIRLTAVLCEPVSIKYLFKAVEQAEKRFPYYRVRLRRGFFWYYLEQVDDSIIILVYKNQIDDFFIRDADKEEHTDAYSHYFKENIPRVVSQPKAFHIPYL